MIYDGCVKIRTVVTMEGGKDSRSGAAKADEVVEAGGAGGTGGPGGPGGVGEADAAGRRGDGAVFFVAPASDQPTEDHTTAQVVHELHLQQSAPNLTATPNPDVNTGSVAPTVDTHSITPTVNIEIVTSAGDILRLLNCGRISFAYAHILNERLAATPTAATNH